MGACWTDRGPAGRQQATCRGPPRNPRACDGAVLPSPALFLHPQATTHPGTQASPAPEKHLRLETQTDQSRAGIPTPRWLRPHREWSRAPASAAVTSAAAKRQDQRCGSRPGSARAQGRAWAGCLVLAELLLPYEHSGAMPMAQQARGAQSVCPPPRGCRLQDHTKQLAPKRETASNDLQLTV